MVEENRGIAMSGCKDRVFEMDRWIDRQIECVCVCERERELV